MTISANIGSFMVPLGIISKGNRPWMAKSGKMYKVDDLKPKKKKKKKTYEDLGMLQVEGAFTVPHGDPEDNKWKIPKLKKVGVWRTIRGRRYFFPDDGSGSIPNIPGDEGKGSKIDDSGEMLEKIDALMLKASRSKGGKVVLKALKTMKAALQADDAEAFKKAEAQLAKSKKKLGKRKGRA